MPQIIERRGGDSLVRGSRVGSLWNEKLSWWDVRNLRLGRGYALRS